MKNVIIVHGCPSNEEKALNPETRTYDKHWMPWLKKELSKKEIIFSAPLMPHPWQKDYVAWKETFDKGDVSSDSILIGHSCGAAFLVRWLGDTGKKVDTLILVAPWKAAEEGDAESEAFYNYEINPGVAEQVGKTIIFTADNEDEEGKESAKIFNTALGGEVINLPGRGHYTESDMGTDEFPELLETILKNPGF